MTRDIFLDEDNEYRCDRCGETWLFFEQDFDFDPDRYPTRCPLCTMPISQMIWDVLREFDFALLVKLLWARLTK